jgi:hypothetical protein
VSRRLSLRLMRAIGSFHGGLINTRLQPGVTSIQRMSRFNPDFAIKLLVGGGASHNFVSNATRLEIGNQAVRTQSYADFTAVLSC